MGPWTRWCIPKQPIVHLVPLQSEKLTKSVRLVQLSDLHTAAWLPQRYIGQICRQVEALEPDLILWTGDFVHTSFTQLQRLMPGFKDLHAAVPTFGVLGNHDYFIPGNQVALLLKESGIRLLRNQGQDLKTKGNHLQLFGIDDYYFGGGFMPVNAFSGKGFRILLTHQPDFCLDLPAEAADLVLAGHLHGGQIRFPGIGPLYFPTPNGWYFTAASLVHRQKIPIHTSQGLGYTMIPIRWACPPAISCIELGPT